MSISPKAPPREWLNSFLEPTLTETDVYKIATPPVDLKLDQNESPFDWPSPLKQKICLKLAEVSWNRYPQAYPKDLEQLVANYAGVSADSVLLSPGSNHLNALTLSLFGKKLGGEVVIAQPSFALYESHCKYDGIKYKTWNLDENFQYSLETLPKLKPGSLVIFATPNNPVGNILPKTTLRKLLSENPQTLFISDEAYYEFSRETSTDLLEEFSNLMIIRTFSKTMGAAGIRLGYLIAAPDYINEIRKMMLPFLINQFSYIAAREVLSDQETLDSFLNTVDMIISERDYCFKALQTLGQNKGFAPIESGANFILIRWHDQNLCEQAYQKLISHGILTRNVSKGPRLAGCLRLSIGTPDQNKRVLECFREL